MSILIKGMGMPEDCPMCPMAHYNRLDEFTGCDIVPGKKHAVTKDKAYANSSARPDWCPLVPVPTPRGDLIDRPTADVRPVVLCRDCKYNNACLTQAFVEEESRAPFDRNTFFCADGERGSNA